MNKNVFFRLLLTPYNYDLPGTCICPRDAPSIVRFNRLHALSTSSAVRSCFAASNVVIDTYGTHRWLNHWPLRTTAIDGKNSGKALL
jgi:hypothetical protein